MTDYLAMRSELPETPKGWRKNLLMHMNCGGRGHMGCYVLLDETGQKTPIGMQYHTKDATLTGFFLPDIKPVMTWKELREIWPIWIERARKKQKAKA